MIFDPFINKAMYYFCDNKIHIAPQTLDVQSDVCIEVNEAFQQVAQMSLRV